MNESNTNTAFGNDNMTVSGNIEYLLGICDGAILSNRKETEPTTIEQVLIY